MLAKHNIKVEHYHLRKSSATSHRSRLFWD
jgi:hypothetical protein